MKNTQVARLLAYVTGMVNQQLLLQNEYLIAENRILRSHLPARVPLTKRATSDTGGNCQADGAAGARTSRFSGQIGNHFGLVSQTDCSQVRWFQRPSLAGTARR